MTTSIRGNAPDLIATALYHLGFRPEHCVLMLGLHRTPLGYCTSGVTARADLTEPEHHRAMAEDLAAVLGRSGSTAALAVVFSDQPRHRVRLLGRFLKAAMDDAAIDVADSFQVIGEHYRGVDCRDRSCCPHPGRPLSEVLDSAAAAALVAQGLTLVESEEALIADVRPVSGSASIPSVAPPGSAAGEDPATSPDLLAEWFEALDDDSARLGGGFAERLLDVTLRDALLLSLSGGSREDAVRFLDDPAAMENFMTAVPDRMMGARAAGLLAGAARNASEDGRAEVLAVLAWLAWWEGSGARSRLLVGEVLDVRPEHRLALLVQSALVRAVPPPWAPADAMACP